MSLLLRHYILNMMVSMIGETIPYAEILQILYLIKIF